MFSYSAIFWQTQVSELLENYFNGVFNTLDCKKVVSRLLGHRQPAASRTF
jgi:hypothetical protein